jgi:exodeoxyribonuclease VIII
MRGKHFMLDLETMGTGNNAAIIQIGCVVFEPLQPGLTSQFKQTVSLQSSIGLGMDVTGGTLAWWRMMAAKQPSALLDHCVPIQEAMLMFDRWYHQQEGWAEMPLWSNGAVFDIPIMETAYRLLGLDVPWHYRRPRDQRTLLDLAEQVGWVKPEVPEATHDALEDCAAQAAMVGSAARYIFDRTGTVI